jgi:hypothetical protein
MAREKEMEKENLIMGDKAVIDTKVVSFPFHQLDSS